MNERYPLSLSGDTFNGLKADFDTILRQLLTEMEKHEAEDGTITIKVGVKLEKDQARDFQANGYDAMRDIVKPSFKHDISTVMQIKDKKTGSLGGSMELAWDRELCQYVMRPIDNGQTSFFDQGKDSGGEVIDAELREVSGPPALKAPEPPALPADDTGEPEAPPVAEKAESTQEVGTTPFEWLRQFVGVKMRVLEAMGHYTVRTTNNQVILSSAAQATSRFYCSDEKLAPHVGHSIICVGSPTDEEKFDSIGIWCEDCDELLFSIDADEAVAPKQSEPENEDDDDLSSAFDGYNYESPQ